MASDSPTVTVHILPQVFKAFQRLHPEIPALLEPVSPILLILSLLCSLTPPPLFKDLLLIFSTRPLSVAQLFPDWQPDQLFHAFFTFVIRG
jgi:hypothetical protein